MDLKKLCFELRNLVKMVGAFIRHESNKVGQIEISEKQRNHLVSYVDVQSEKRLVEGLKVLIPDSGFIAEENTVEPSESDWQWIIDPLDGTTNFLYSIPSYAISIGLQYCGKMVLGMVYEVNRSECFYAWEGGGAFLNNSSISVSKTSTLDASLLATGFPYYDYALIDSYLEVLKELMLKTKGLRRLGAAAVDLCYVACGRFDGFYEYSLSPWDVAAGAFIVQEAGGTISDFKGGDDWLWGRSIVATNSFLQSDLQGLLENMKGLDSLESFKK